MSLNFGERERSEHSRRQKDRICQFYSHALGEGVRNSNLSAPTLVKQVVTQILV